MKGSRPFPILRVFRSLTGSAEGQVHCEVLKEHLVIIGSYFLKLILLKMTQEMISDTCIA